MDFFPPCYGGQVVLTLSHRVSDKKTREQVRDDKVAHFFSFLNHKEGEWKDFLNLCP